MVPPLELILPVPPPLPPHAHTEMGSEKERKETAFVLCRVKLVRYVSGSAEISQGGFLEGDELDSKGEVGVGVER